MQTVFIRFGWKLSRLAIICLSGLIVVGCEDDYHDDDYHDDYDKRNLEVVVRNRTHKAVVVEYRQRDEDPFHHDIDRRSEFINPHKTEDIDVYFSHEEEVVTVVRGEARKPFAIDRYDRTLIITDHNFP